MPVGTKSRGQALHDDLVTPLQLFQSQLWAFWRLLTGELHVRPLHREHLPIALHFHLHCSTHSFEQWGGHRSQVGGHCYWVGAASSGTRITRMCRRRRSSSRSSRRFSSSRSGSNTGALHFRRKALKKGLSLVGLLQTRLSSKVFVHSKPEALKKACSWVCLLHCFYTTCILEKSRKCFTECSTIQLKKGLSQKKDRNKRLKVRALQKEPLPRFCLPSPP